MTRYTPLYIQPGIYPASQDRQMLGSIWPGPASSGMACSAAGTTITIQPGVVAIPTANASGTTLGISDAPEQVILTGPPLGGTSRIDLILVQARGNDLDGGTNNDLIFTFATGTAASSPVAPATPAGTTCLYQAQMDSTGAVTLTDVRPWALHPHLNGGVSIAPTPATVPLTLQGAVGQTANLITVKDSNPAYQSYRFTLDPTGYYFFHSQQGGFFWLDPGARTEHEGAFFVYPNKAGPYQGLTVDNTYDGVDGISLMLRPAYHATSDVLQMMDYNNNVLGGIDSTGRYYMGPQPSFGSGTGPMMFFGNDTTDPPGLPVGGTIVYSSTGVLKAKTPDGTVTQIAPFVATGLGMVPLTLTSTATTMVPLTIQAYPGQTANLFQAQTRDLAWPSWTNVFTIDPLGYLTINGATISRFSDDVPLVVQQAPQSGLNADLLQITTKNIAWPGVSKLSWFDSQGMLHITAYYNAVPLTITANPGQTADLLEIKNNGGTKLSWFDANGSLTFKSAVTSDINLTFVPAWGQTADVWTVMGPYSGTTPQLGVTVNSPNAVMDPMLYIKKGGVSWNTNSAIEIGAYNYPLYSLAITGNGTLWWGDGNNTQDVSLSRSAARQLLISNALVITGSPNGPETLTVNADSAQGNDLVRINTTNGATYFKPNGDINFGAWKASLSGTPRYDWIVGQGNSVFSLGTNFSPAAGQVANMIQFGNFDQPRVEMWCAGNGMIFDDRNWSPVAGTETFSFRTLGTYLFGIYNSGAIAVGSRGGPFGDAGSAPFGGGTGPMFFLQNDTADPTSNPAGGTIIYSSAGVLKARTPDGTVTQIAPAAGAGVTAPLTLTSTAAGMIPLTLVGAASQTADLFQVKNNAAAIMAGVDASGDIYSAGTLTGTSVGGPLQNNDRAYFPAANYVSVPRFLMVGTSGTGATAQLTVLTAATGNTGISVKLQPSPTGDVFTAYNSGGSALMGINNSGQIYLGTTQSFGGGTGPMMFFGNDTADPSSNPFGGVLLYSSAGVLKARTPSGAIVQLAPAVATMSWPLTDNTSNNQANPEYQTQVSGDTNYRFAMTTGGVLSWGPGSAGFDTSLQRNAAGLMTLSANLTIVNQAAVGNVPLTVQGMASQSGDYFDIKTSTAAKVVYVDSGGALRLNAQATTSVPFFINLVASQTGDALRVLNSTPVVIAKIDANGGFTSSPPTGGYQAYQAMVSGDTYARWQADVGGNMAWGTGAATTDTTFSRGLSGGLVMGGPAAAVLFTIQQAASATRDVLQIKNSGGTVLAGFDLAGHLYLGSGFSGSGTGPMMFLANDTADPSSNPTGGVVLFVSAGVLKARDPSGTITQLAPGAGVTWPLNWLTAASANSAAIQLMVSGDTYYRYTVAADGGTYWGTGAVANDSSLRRLGTGMQMQSPNFNVMPTVVTAVPLSVQGLASQSANLFEARTNTGTVLWSISNAGSVIAIQASAGGAVEQSWQSADPNPRFVRSAGGTMTWGAGSAAGDVTLSRNSPGSLSLGFAGTATRAALGISGGLTLFEQTTSLVPLTVWGVASQTADLQQFKNSGGTILGGYDATGRLYLGATASWGAGTGTMMFLGNDTLDPSSNPTGGVVLYSSGGVLMARTPTGNTQLAPALGPIGGAGGDLAGSYPNPTVARINGTTVPAAPTAGQVLTATSGTAATWQTPATVSVTAPLTLTSTAAAMVPLTLVPYSGGQTANILAVTPGGGVTSGVNGNGAFFYIGGDFNYIGYRSNVNGDSGYRLAITDDGIFTWAPGNGIAAVQMNYSSSAFRIISNVSTLTPLQLTGAASPTVDFFNILNSSLQKLVWVDSAGNLNVDTAGDAQPRFQVGPTGLTRWGSGAGAMDVSLQRSATGVLGLSNALWITALAGTVPLQVSGAASQASNLLVVSPNGGGSVVVNASANVTITPSAANVAPLILQAVASQTSDMLINFSSGGARMSGFDATGRLYVAANASWGGGSGSMMFLGNDTADPSSNPSGGVILFSSAGVLKARDPSGAVTTIAPAPATLAFPLTNTAASSATNEYQTNVSGDTFYRFQMAAAGQMYWGPGNASPEISLQRTAASVLTLSAGLVVGPGGAYPGVVPLTVGGPSGGTADLLQVTSSGSMAMKITVTGAATHTALAATSIPLTIQGAASQSVDLLDITNSSSTKLFYVDSTGKAFSAVGLSSLSGNLALESPSGSLMVNQTSKANISVYGATTVFGSSGATSLAVMSQGATGNLFVIGSGVSTILAGFDNTGRLFLGSGSSSVFAGGTGPMMYFSTATADPSSNPAGGAIVYYSAGVLKAKTPDGSVTVLAPQSGMAPLTLTAPTSTVVPLTVVGAASQSADIFDVKLSTGTKPFFVDSGGNTYFAGAQAWVNTGGAVYATGLYNVGATGYIDNTGKVAGTTAFLTSPATTAIPFVVKLAAGQTGDALEIQASNGVVQSGFDSTGRLYLGSAPSFGAGTGPMLFIGNDTADPSGFPTGGTILFTNSSAQLMAYTSDGNSTILAPTFYNFIYNQTLTAPTTASSPYTITHNLNSTNVMVELWDAVTLAMVQAQVRIVDVNRISVSVSANMPNNINVVVFGVPNAPVPVNPSNYANKAYVDARTPNLPAPVSSGSGLQSFTDILGDVWVAQNGVASGAWKRARDVLHGASYRATAFNVTSTTTDIGYDSTYAGDAYGFYNGNATTGGIWTCGLAGWYSHSLSVGATVTAAGQIVTAVMRNVGGSSICQANVQSGSTTGVLIPIAVFSRSFNVGDQVRTGVSGTAATIVGRNSLDSTRYCYDYLGTG